MITGSTEVIGSIALATIPVLLWSAIFFKKEKEKKKMATLTFLMGALAVFPILLYKLSWQFFPWLNAFKFAENFENDLIGLSNVVYIPISVILTFMIVGLIEEIMKMLCVQIVDKNQIKSIDDSMEYFIIAALGFSFTENILYFYSIWINHGAENLLVPFLFRSSFSTFAHILFSGVLGYYYGIAHFATPILQENIRKNRSLWLRIMHKVFSIREEKLFHQEKIMEGLVISIFLHALFNIFLEMSMTFMIVPFLYSGYLLLNYLFNRKDSHKQYNNLLEGTRNNHFLIQNGEI